jgi:hypothetical protein
MIVCLDADCAIYFVEQNPVWGPKVTARPAALRPYSGADVADRYTANDASQCSPA